MILVRRRVLLGIVASATISWGCATPLPATPPPVASVSRVASTSPSPAGFQRWRTFRETWGLATDDAWMAKVAATPGAFDNDFEIPLLPAEVDAIGRQVTSLNGVIGALVAYGGRYPDSYRAVIAEGSTAVLLMKEPAEPFVTELEQLLPSGTPFEVRPTAHSRKELETVAARVLADDAWFTSQGLELIDASVGATALVVGYQGGTGNEPPAIKERYGGDLEIEVEWEGAVPWDGPVGTVVVQVVDARGRPASEGTVCDAKPVDPTIHYEPGVAFVTDKKGVCRLPYVPAVVVEVLVWRFDQSLVGQPAATRRATVTRDGAVRVTVTLPGE
jgi:hypothetical protein